ncbi:MAG: hypothetical protein MH204_02785 [Fimbriimonadaceae bacterium]|nr:hypothetical protein [Fimbriimonadaceae bacterium]
MIGGLPASGQILARRAALARGLAIAAGVLLVLGFGADLLLAGREGRSAREADELEAQMKARRTDLAALEEQARDTMTGLQAVTRIQESLVQLGRTVGVSVTSFQSSPQLAPFLSGYGTPAPGGWLMAGVEMEAEGNALALARFIRSFPESGLRFEVAEVRLTPGPAAPEGKTMITAGLRLVVLTRDPAASTGGRS